MTQRPWTVNSVPGKLLPKEWTWSYLKFSTNKTDAEIRLMLLRINPGLTVEIEALLQAHDDERDSFLADINKRRKENGLNELTLPISPQPPLTPANAQFNETKEAAAKEQKSRHEQMMDYVIKSLSTGVNALIKQSGSPPSDEKGIDDAIHWSVREPGKTPEEMHKDSENLSNKFQDDKSKPQPRRNHMRFEDDDDDGYVPKPNPFDDAANKQRDNDFDDAEHRSTAAWIDLKQKTGKTDAELTEIIRRVDPDFDVEMFNMLEEFSNAQDDIMSKIIRQVGYEAKHGTPKPLPPKPKPEAPKNIDRRTMDERLDDDSDERAALIKKEFDAWRPGDPPTDVPTVLAKVAQVQYEARLKAHGQSPKTVHMPTAFDDIEKKIAKHQSDELELLVQLKVAEVQSSDAALKKTSEGHLADARKSLEAFEAAPKKAVNPVAREHKLSLYHVFDEVKNIVNAPETAATAANSNTTRNQKEETIMTDKTTAVTVTATTHDGAAPAITVSPITPEDLSSQTKNVSDKVRKAIIIDPATGAAGYGDLKFDDLLEFCPATHDEITRSLTSLNIIAVGVTHGHGMEASKAVKIHDKLKAVVGKFPGPVKGSHLAVSYSRSTTMPSGDSTKVYSGTMTSSWKGIGGPGGNEFDAVKAAIRAASEAGEAN